MAYVYKQSIVGFDLSFKIVSTQVSVTKEEFEMVLTFYTCKQWLQISALPATEAVLQVATALSGLISSVQPQ